MRFWQTTLGSCVDKRWFWMPFKSDDKLVEGFQKSDMIESSFYEITLVALQGRDCIGARVEAEIS